MRKLLAVFLVVLVFASPRATAGWNLLSQRPLAAPAGLDFTERTVESSGAQASLWVVTFDPKAHTFAVMDNPEGAFDLGSAAEKRGALAGVNGGYFQPDRTPLGLLTRQGVEIHPLEHSRLLAGILSITPAGIALQRTAAFKPSPAVREALQAGPFLVERGRPVAGLNADKVATRTVVFQTVKGRWGVLIAKSVSLAEMAEVLAAPPVFPEGAVQRALNLDGGTSTALWVRGAPPFYSREWKSVRDYLAILAR